MTTNTYQALCDDVEAYDEKNSCKKDFECGFLESNDFDTCIYCSEYSEYKKYYKQSAEQRERLEELILDKKLGLDLCCHKTYPREGALRGYSYFIQDVLGDTKYFVFDKTRPEALYALTHKLVDEGVLNKKEVAKALKGGE